MYRLINLVSVLILLSFLAACGGEVGSIFPSPFQTQNTLITISGDSISSAITQYDINGNFMRIVGNFRIAGGTPRGLASHTFDHFLVSLETGDRIEQVSMDTTISTFHGSNLLNGNIYDLEYGKNGYYYQVETNGIEVFDLSGNRIAARYIPTTTGACVLSNPRGMTIDQNGRLLVVNQGGTDELLFYDISNETATCVNNVAIGNNPYDILAHSDGYLYITLQGNDEIIRTDADGSNATTIWTVDLTYINNPTAIVEHPSGDLLIASSARDSVERIQRDGLRVGAQPFIADATSLNINDIIIVEGIQ